MKNLKDWKYNEQSACSLMCVMYIVVAALTCSIDAAAQTTAEGWRLVWHDEFDTDGRPDSTKWTYERGFVRNEEAQWYAPENVFQRDGHLVIEARPADFPCPTYQEGSTQWRHNRPRILWTSGAVVTKDLFSFQYGRVEVCARIPVCLGAWPAIWLLGIGGGWPACGEIDMMEYYQYEGRPTVLANACWAGDTMKGTQWDSSYTPLTHFTDRDPAWASRFHVWRMDWDEKAIRLYLDDELLNEIDLAKTINGRLRGTGINPFHHPHFLLLNLALDTRIKHYAPADFPMRYEIDYVRVFQK
ncbi:MAG: glycoside hydrolase family 16 protein [Bacteroidaceae bacterium]|nr:glycoside hydrolase family 16 protein [Bacteroidaceae bacterium]